MPNFSLSRIAYAAALSIIGLTLFSTTVAAQSVKVEGLIQARNGDTMIVKTADSTNVTVLLLDSTDVGQVQGMLKARKKEMSMAALIPGLPVKVEGTHNDQNQLVATSVRFKGNDLQQAQAIEAGMHETKAQTAENKAAIAAAVARFGQLDDYYILDEQTVYFDNGKIAVDPKYNSQLVTLAEKAKPIDGYLIEVKGYASSVGSTGVNQKLSEDRANNVTNILIQQGHIPLTRMLAPGAMGESEQVGDEKTVEGQAESRRVVVRVLQNKAVAGTGEAK